MDISTNPELPAFIDFCKSLDAGVVHTPEQALELYRGKNGPPNTSENLAQALIQQRQQIVASGVRLLNEQELDAEIAARRGEKLAAE